MKGLMALVGVFFITVVIAVAFAYCSQHSVIFDDHLQRGKKIMVNNHEYVCHETPESFIMWERKYEVRDLEIELKERHGKRN